MEGWSVIRGEINHLYCSNSIDRTKASLPKLTQKRRVDSGPPCVLSILDEQVYVELLLDYKGAAIAAVFAMGQIRKPNLDDL